MRAEGSTVKSGCTHTSFPTRLLGNFICQIPLRVGVYLHETEALIGERSLGPCTCPQLRHSLPPSGGQDRTKPTSKPGSTPGSPAFRPDFGRFPALMRGRTESTWGVAVGAMQVQLPTSPRLHGRGTSRSLHARKGSTPLPSTLGVHQIGAYHADGPVHNNEQGCGLCGRVVRCPTRPLRLFKAVGMTDKTCTQCGEAKPEGDFRIKIRAKGIRISLCHPCDKAYRAERWKRADKAKGRQEQQRLSALRQQRVATGEIREPPTKVCLQCQLDLPLGSFRWKDEAKGFRIARCQECDVQDRAARYARNPAQYLDNKRRTQAHLKAVLNHRKDGPCMDCGGVFPPCVMDFDHRDPSTKVCKVSSLVYSGSEQLLLDEIAKCDLVCSNCHRIRTHPTMEKCT